VYTAFSSKGQDTCRKKGIKNDNITGGFPGTEVEG